MLDVRLIDRNHLRTGHAFPKTIVVTTFWLTLSTLEPPFYWARSGAMILVGNGVRINMQVPSLLGYNLRKLLVAETLTPLRRFLTTCGQTPAVFAEYSNALLMSPI